MGVSGGILANARNGNYRNGEKVEKRKQAEQSEGSFGESGEDPVLFPIFSPFL